MNWVNEMKWAQLLNRIPTFTQVFFLIGLGKLTGVEESYNHIQ